LRFAAVFYGLVGLLFLTAVQVPALAAGPADYNLGLTAPAGWQEASENKIPARLGGTYLAGWYKDVQLGRAVIYVIASRSKGQFLLEDMVDVLAGFMQSNKLEPALDTGFNIAGRPAGKVIVTGKGTGQIVNGISQGVTGKLDTYMEIALFTNFWANKGGTDLIQVVFAAPLGSKDILRPGYKGLLQQMKLTGQYQPPVPAAKPVAAASAQGATTAPVPTVASEKVVGLTDKMPEAGAQLHFVLPVLEGTSASWSVKPDEKAAFYVLLWPQKRANWVIPAAEFARTATAGEGLLTLKYGEALRPYMGRWDLVWPTN